MDSETLPPALDGADDFYALLQVSPRADAEVIEAAYRVLARRYHPDVNRAPDATVTMARLNVAWETLRDAASRAAYDMARNEPRDQTAPFAQTEPVGWAATVAAERQQPAGAPVLMVEPTAIDAGRVRRGVRRSFALTVQTEPPGIRVTTAVSAGTQWLAVAPAVLKGLEKEDVTVQLRTRPLRPGVHQGGIELATSWESRLVPVQVEVVPASLAFRIGGLAHIAATNRLLLAVLAMLSLLVVLLAVALR